jgi:hypothetical protein
LGLHCCPVAQVHGTGVECVRVRVTDVISEVALLGSGALLARWEDWEDRLHGGGGEVGSCAVRAPLDPSGLLLGRVGGPVSFRRRPSIRGGRLGFVAGGTVIGWWGCTLPGIGGATRGVGDGFSWAELRVRLG